MSEILFYFYCISINFEMFDPINSDGKFSLSKMAAIFYIISKYKKLGFYLSINKLNKKFLMPIIWMVVTISILSIINMNEHSKKIIDFPIILNVILFIIIINDAKKNIIFLEKGMMAFCFGGVLSAMLLFLGLEMKLVDREG